MNKHTCHSMNPNHETTRALEGQWHKVLAMLMVKIDMESFTLTEDDVARIATGGINIVAKDDATGLHIWLASDAEASRLARQAGGLPT